MQSVSLVRHKQQIVLVIEMESVATNNGKYQIFVLVILSAHDWHAQMHCGF